MDIVDVILAVTTAFFIIILFSTISYESSTIGYKIEEYKNKIDSTDKVFETLLSIGYPEYWYVDPSSANYFGILKENYGYEVDETKIGNLSSLCTTNEALVKQKLFVPDDYHVYIYLEKILTGNTLEVCDPPSSPTQRFIRETFVDYEGEISLIKVEVWK